MGIGRKSMKVLKTIAADAGAGSIVVVVVTAAGIVVVVATAASTVVVVATAACIVVAAANVADTVIASTVTGFAEEPEVVAIVIVLSVHY